MQSLAATYMLLSLCTGTVLSLLGQQMTTFGVHPSANLYVWVQYVGHFLYTQYTLLASPRTHTYTSRQKLFLAAIGSCHVGAFLVFMPAVDKIGVALYQIIYSSGLVLTAVMARVVLQKVPSKQQLLGIAVVSAGLVHSGWGTLAQSGTKGTSQTDLAVGVALSFTATVLFCATPILVELVNSDVPAAMRLGSADVGGAAAKLGSVVMTLYVALWTWPRKEQLVLQPLAGSGTSQQQVLAWYLLNLVVYVLHNTFYLETTKHAGAVGNGLVNGVRSATVVLSSAALFCSQKPALCLDVPKCITVLLLVAGGLIYTAAPPATYLAAPTTRASKRLAAKGIKKRA